MYLEFYQLREQPFGVTPDPRFLYFGATHREALASLMYAIQEKRGFSALIAEPGMGKTSLLFRLLQSHTGTARTAFLFQTDGDTRDLLRSLLTDLGISTAHADMLAMRETLHGVLIQEMNAGRPVIVVIDEAQNLDDSALESIRMLSNFETPAQKLMHIILAGQPGLAEKLSAARLVQLRQRIGSVIRLEPFGPRETSDYIEHRLRAAGRNAQPIFTPDACELISRASLGIPRNINSICFQALSLGYALQAAEIGEEIIREILVDCDFAVRPARLKPQVSRGIIEPPAAHAHEKAPEKPQDKAPASPGRVELPPPVPPPLEPGRRVAQAVSQAAIPPIPPAASQPISQRPAPSARPFVKYEPPQGYVPIPGFAPAPRSRGVVKWFAIPAIALLLLGAVSVFSGGRLGVDASSLREAYGHAVSAISSLGEHVASPAAAPPEPAAQPAAAPSTQRPTPAKQPVVEPAPKSALPAQTDSPSAHATDAAVKPVRQPEQTVVVIPKTMTAADIARVYLGDSEWHTMYKLLALNPEIGWSYQDVAKGTRVNLPRPPIAGAAEAAAAKVPATPRKTLGATSSRSTTSPRDNRSTAPPVLVQAHDGPKLIEVSHSESLFQLALESYGRSSWVIVDQICKANPQLQGVYAVLHEGDLVELPDPATIPDSFQANSKSKPRP